MQGPETGLTTSSRLESAKQRLKSITFKHQATPLSAFCGTFLTLGGLAFFEKELQLLGDETALLFVGSFGALSTLIFAAPAAPLGIPYNTLLGHTLSIGIAVIVHWMEFFWGFHLWGKVLSPSLAIGAMLATGVTNPPAAAIVVIFATSPKALGQFGYGAMFMLTPALVGCVYAYMVQALIARLMTQGVMCCGTSDKWMANEAKRKARMQGKKSSKDLVTPSKPKTFGQKMGDVGNQIAEAIAPEANKPPVVEVRVVDRTIALAIARCGGSARGPAPHPLARCSPAHASRARSAVMGAAYIPDPLTYIIDRLVAEQKKQRAVVQVQAVARGRNSRKIVVAPRSARRSSSPQKALHELEAKLKALEEENRALKTGAVRQSSAVRVAPPEPDSPPPARGPSRTLSVSYSSVDRSYPTEASAPTTARRNRRSSSPESYEAQRAFITRAESDEPGEESPVLRSSFARELLAGNESGRSSASGERRGGPGQMARNGSGGSSREFDKQLDLLSKKVSKATLL
eukprot:Transcript_6764.p1 GENE.Transcript_6764~~Transcript_6764.p1  ORF type:complete len:516 (-),score=83.33 Transcript_6764:32-1579(-)